MCVELALEVNKLALQVTLEALESIKNWSANFAAAWSCVAWIARSDFNATAWCCSCTRSSDFNATAWISLQTAWSDFNAARWISNNCITARAGSATAFSAEQTVE